MIRSTIIITLLSIWLFAIFAPPIISLLNSDGSTIITVNLNEEEQPEQGKKNIAEKKIVYDNTNYSFLAQLKNSTSSDFYLLANFDHTLEIILPPPESLI
ncbi:hypothetical protein [Kriegella aquimaris]|uniref:Uncharacterized protein n=1 Tax=Kriegella aquimaris TaxID=192904 RepID=A0A1G9LQT3_9FLAO|nr:hypothetical protein [Kriegella aquimaris]SDL64402.1 hypothetical protein SAMN04488514_102193 [Kriegella aquimaris]